MKRIVMFFMVVCCFLATKPAEAWNPYESTTGTLVIRNGSMEVSLKQSCGKVLGIENGGFLLSPSEIKQVIWCSDRTGWYENSTAKAPYINGRAVIQGIPNNDQGILVVEATKGKRFPLINTDDLRVITYPVIFYDGTEGWFEYGEFRDSIMSATTDGVTMSLSCQMNCNKLISVQGNPDPKDISGFEFRTTSGAIVYAPIEKDSEGNISFEIAGIPWEYGDYGQKIISGRLYAVSLYGEEYPFEFFSYERSKYDRDFGWYISGDNIGLTYSETERVLITIRMD